MATSKMKASLPKGFKAITGGGGDAIEWKKAGQIVHGVVIEVKTVARKVFKKGEDPNFRILRIKEKGTGKEVGVFEKAALRGLFDAAKKGREVYIEFLGMGKKVGKKSPPYLFNAGIK